LVSDGQEFYVHVDGVKIELNLTPFEKNDLNKAKQRLEISQNELPKPNIATGSVVPPTGQPDLAEATRTELHAKIKTYADVLQTKNNTVLSSLLPEEKAKAVNELIRSGLTAEKQNDGTYLFKFKSGSRKINFDVKEDEKNVLSNIAEYIAKGEPVPVVSDAVQKNIYEQALKLNHSDTDVNDVVKTLTTTGMIAKKNNNGEYDFYLKGKNGATDMKIELDKNGEMYSNFKGIGKYLAYPDLDPKLIDLDIHNKVLALDKGVVELLPAFGAKVIIHGMLFDADPENTDCKFKSEEFEKLCKYIKDNAGKMKSVKYKYGNTPLTAAQMVTHAGGEGDPYVLRYPDNFNEGTVQNMNTGFVFDRIEKINDHYEYKAVYNEPEKKGDFYVVMPVRAAKLAASKNHYLKYKTSE
jgi:predicted transcriptional regulator